MKSQTIITFEEELICYTVGDRFKVFTKFGFPYLQGEFGRFDRNRDGFIEGDELRQVALAFGYSCLPDCPEMSSRTGPSGRGCPPSQVFNEKKIEEAKQKLLAKFDKNRDKKIGFNEFKKILICSLTEDGKEKNELKKQLKVVKKYKNAVQEFRKNITVDDIKKDPFEDPREYEANFPVIGKYPSLSYMSIMRIFYYYGLESTPPKLSDEWLFKDIEKNVEKYLPKIEALVKYLDDLILFLETV